MRGHPVLIALVLGSLATTASPALAEPADLLSLQEGAVVVSRPPTFSGWDAEQMLDGSPRTGWACKAGQPEGNVFVFELATEAVFDRFEFDTAAIDAKGASAKDLKVEISSTSAEADYTTILEVSLVAKKDRQVFPVTRKVIGRWVRLTLKNNHGNAQYTELFSFKGIGERPPTPPPKKISGAYTSSYSTFHVRQQGSALVGCYEHDQGLLSGIIEGRVMKITWREGGGDDDYGPAVLVFAEDGQSFQGFWWHHGRGEGAPSGKWIGKKKSEEVGGCPHWSGSLSGELKKQLDTEKRARLYGLLFDTDSATLRAESKPVLDEVLLLLKGAPDWKLTIEGHTDAQGAEAHNQSLSLARAKSVKTYLTAAGIEASRLKTAGFGESRPVGDNATSLGRAQNRRVELVRE